MVSISLWKGYPTTFLQSEAKLIRQEIEPAKMEMEFKAAMRGGLLASACWPIDYGDGNFQSTRHFTPGRSTETMQPRSEVGEEAA